jgi:AcrR family transcriptional regulator
MERDDKKKLIMRAVEQLADGRKLSEITLDEVIKAAKIGKGTIYHYFENKEDLLFETAASGFDELCAILEQKVPNNVSFTEKLNKAYFYIVRFFADRRRLLQIMQAYSSYAYWANGRFRERWISRRRKLIHTLSNILSEGAAEGMIRPDLSTEFLAASFLGMLRAYVTDTDISSDSTQNGKMLIDLFANGACSADNKFTVNCREAVQVDG